MNNITMNNAKVTMTKKLTLAATFFVTMALSSSSFAHQFDVDAEGQQAIQEHHQLMNQHMASAEQEYTAELEQDFNQQLETAEHNFMEKKCANRGLDFDDESEVCEG
ncbi:hypothetical protein [Shewanella japonica]|uniref:hypothetical protein n=1 Tax=Shewanella japonica TaxID=93973 RepID=UPI00249587C9|nr:hypothetical protein [Shewanella japonica]